MTMFAAPSTSTKQDRPHADRTADGKTAGHAVARHGRRLEDAGTRSSEPRTEFPGTTLAAGRSTMELARESGVGAQTESGQTEGTGMRGGHRLSGGAGPGQDGDACSGKRLSLGPPSRKHFRVGPDRCGQELYRFGPGAESLSRRPLGSLPAGGRLASDVGPRPTGWQLAPSPGTTQSHRCSGYR